MSCPRLYISWFDDHRGQTQYYLDRIRSLNIPKPTETLIPLPTQPPFTQTATQIKDYLDTHSWNKAFLKTDCKAAVNDLKSGSFIIEPTLQHIERTIESLLTQNNAQNWPHGDHLVLREWLDLNFCLQLSHSCHPEIRYFIDDGKIIGHTPHNFNAQHHTCAQQYNYLTNTLQNATPPDHYAQQVANEFTEATWGVDFALDTNGDWYFIEMNFNGVYWNTDTQSWWNMTGQGDNEPYSPLEMHKNALPHTIPTPNR